MITSNRLLCVHWFVSKETNAHSLKLEDAAHEFFSSSKANVSDSLIHLNVGTVRSAVVKFGHVAASPCRLKCPNDLQFNLVPAGRRLASVHGTDLLAAQALAGDLGLGDEIDGLDGVQDEDVEPAGMVGDDGTGAGHRPTLDHKRQAEDAQRAAADEAGDMRRDRAGLAAKRPFDQPDEEEKGQPAEPAAQGRGRAPQPPSARGAR